MASARAQTAPIDLVVVYIYEAGNYATTIITRGEQRTEESEFEMTSYKNASKECAEDFCHVLSGLYKEGYVVRSSTKTYSSGSGGERELIFTKNSQ
ncbi:hypothetical protein GCM10023172_39600 [Hymenobacter ginsengisoli]|uniref:Uncharacterized protein n=1 Tax=Hymenobacter ginsengisoli TaxID=1051626 RepID=A0ABP8QSN9_9BACT